MSEKAGVFPLQQPASSVEWHRVVTPLPRTLVARVLITSALVLGGCRALQPVDGLQDGGPPADAAPPTVDLGHPDLPTVDTMTEAAPQGPGHLVFVNETNLQTTEHGGQAGFAVKLDSQPTASVKLGLASSNPAEGVISLTALTFTPSNWNAPQVVMITGIDDSSQDGNVPYTIVTAPTISDDPRFDGIESPDVMVTNLDDETAGIQVLTGTLHTTEAGGQATFTVNLISRPAATVTIPLTSSNPAEGQATVASLVFTSANWNAPQLVTVTGMDDAQADGPQNYVIRLEPAQSADANYQGVDGTDVALVNVDDDSAGITLTAPVLLVTSEIGGQAEFTLVLNTRPTADVIIDLASSDPGEGAVTPARVTFTPVNWKAPQTLTVTGLNDDLADGNQVYTVSVTTITSADPLYAALPHPTVDASNVDDDTAGVLVRGTSASTLTVTEAGTQATLSVVLTSAPTADVTIPVNSSDLSEGSVNPTSLVFNASNWKAPQIVTVTGVGDSLSDGNQPFTILVGTVVSADPNYNGIDPPNLSAVNIDDDTSGITVTPTAGLTTTEAGGQASFSIVLNAQPTANVMIGLSSSDPAEGTISASSVTFTPTNWNAPQVITVTGVDDARADGNQVFRVITSMATSLGSDYAGMNPPDVTLSNTDNDTARITVTPVTGLVTSEAAGTATFTVVLNSQPTADVVVPLSSSDTTEGTVSPASVTFTSVNWAAPQTVTVTGVNDDLGDGSQPYIITTAVAISGDTGYSGLDPANVEVTNTDNDTAGFTIAPTSGLITSEAGGTATFTIVLNSQPNADVTVPLSTSDASEASIAPASVTFTSANWAAPRTVTVTGINDDLADGTQPYTIITGAATGTDTTGYSGLDPVNVAAATVDNDTAGVTVTPSTGLVTTEGGGTATFTIALNSQPTANVTIALSSSDLSEGTVSPASVTFTSANWATAQTVTVTGVNDALADGNQNYSIVTGAATSMDTTGYNGIDAANASVSNTDNDSAGFTVTPSSGLVTTEAGGTATFTIALNSQPNADVTIGLTSSSTGEGTVAPASVTFTGSNWNVAQTVTVTGVDDAAGDGDVTYTIVTSPAVSTDLVGYNGLNPPDVSLTNRAFARTTLVAGRDSACALKPNGAAYCWGRNDFGQLGDGTTTHRNAPVAVLGGLTFATIESKHLHTCGLTTAGAAYCWGLNDNGQIGDNTNTNATQPTLVLGGHVFVQLHSGGSHVCGLTAAGQAWCWGNNSTGHLGNGTNAGSKIPVAVTQTGGLTFARLWLGSDTTCGLTAAGAAYCWGRNAEGELGDGTNTSRNTPGLVSGGLAFRALSGGWFHMCGLTTTGQLHCWGLNNDHQLGDGSTTAKNAPGTPIGPTFDSVSGSDYFTTCGVIAGAAHCWGYNANGQAGDGTLVSVATPTVVTGGLAFGTLNGGQDHTCGQTTGGAIYCWGDNVYGQIGDASNTDRPAPTLVTLP
jgi:alpha-tubulin suppressor-like RCC1 family protein